MSKMSIRKPKDWEKVSPLSDAANPMPTPDAYFCKIVGVEIKKSRKHNQDMLKIDLDIARGAFKDFFANDKKHKEQVLCWSDAKWGLSTYLVIDFEDAQTGTFFKRKFKWFLDCVALSNFGFAFNWDDINCLVGRSIGALVCISEYESSNNKIRSNYVVDKIFETDVVLNGKHDPAWIADPDGRRRNPNDPPPPRAKADDELDRVEEADIPF